MPFLSDFWAHFSSKFERFLSPFCKVLIFSYLQKRKIQRLSMDNLSDRLSLFHLWNFPTYLWNFPYLSVKNFPTYLWNFCFWCIKSIKYISYLDRMALRQKCLPICEIFPTYPWKNPTYSWKNPTYLWNFPYLSVKNGVAIHWLWAC